MLRGNRILDGLRAEETALLRPHLEEMGVRRGKVLVEAGQPATHLYFPIDCVLALVGTTEAGATVEVALVGFEGVAGVSAALGRQRSPFRMVAQFEGHVGQLRIDAITRQAHQYRDLYRKILDYSHAVIAQVGQSAVCNRFHTARQRLARWLLMTSDLMGSRELPMTHEFIAHMVGGPRSAVTEAASALRASGAIDYRRGVITIRNLSRLRLEACECYEAALEGAGRR